MEGHSSLEHRRARELNALLGPKRSADPRTDFIIDLHNTTAQTGVALMLAPDDSFAHEVPPPPLFLSLPLSLSLSLSLDFFRRRDPLNRD